ncbi:MAG: VOC family protein [Sphingomonadales bacterium]
MSRRTFFQISLLVRDYDEAIEFYTKTLDFNLLEDTPLTDTKRWVVVAPQGNPRGQLLLAKAVGDAQVNRIGDQSGGRVFLFMYTDNLQEDHLRLRSRGVKIVRGPLNEPFGSVLVFEDLYGNRWDLIEKKGS